MIEDKLKQAEEDSEYATFLSILRKNHIKSHNKEKQCLDCSKMQNNSTFKKEKKIIKTLLLFLTPALTVLLMSIFFIVVINI